MPLPIRLGTVLSALAPPLCWSCRGAARMRDPLCHGCRRRLRFLDAESVAPGGVRLWAAVAYEGPARDLVHGLKYRGAPGLADALAAQIAATAPTGVLRAGGEPPTATAEVYHQWQYATDTALRAGGEPPTATAEGQPPVDAISAAPSLVPVPGGPARVRRRGYDQAALLAAALARRTDLLVAACLARSDVGLSQVGRGRGARQAAVAGAIRLRSPPPPAAVLVDDVVTTGATLRACARVLRDAGCAQVVAVAYARTPGR